MDGKINALKGNKHYRSSFILIWCERYALYFAETCKIVIELVSVRLYIHNLFFPTKIIIYNSGVLSKSVVGTNV